MKCAGFKYYIFRFPFFLVVLTLFFVQGLLPQSRFPLPCFAASADADAVLATVNNVPVTKSNLEKHILEYKKKLRKKHVTAKEKKRLLENLIIRELILQQPTVEDLRNDKEIVKKVKDYENTLIVDRLLEDQVKSKARVTEKELIHYYQENREKLLSSQKVDARVILLRTRQEAEEVLLRLRKGEDFGHIAKELSIDLPTAINGGSMKIKEKGKFLPDIGKVLFSLKAGEISDIVETDFGYNIFTVDKMHPAGPKPFEKARNEIKKIIVQQKEARAFNEMTKRLKRNAEVRIYEDRLEEFVH